MNDKTTNLFAGKRRMVWFAIALLLVAGGLSWYINRSREPMYEGKPLTYWLECYAPTNRTEPSGLEAKRAIQAIGTNAIPFLMSLLQTNDSRLDLRLAALLSKQSFVRVHWHPAEPDQWLAYRGFLVLGSKGSPAVPKLMSLYQNDTNVLCRAVIIESLGAIGPLAKDAVPMLASSLIHAHDPNRVVVLSVLGSIHSDPAVSIPALTNCLNDYRYPPRLTAVWALTPFRSEARPAVPQLLKLLHDKYYDVRQAAEVALWQIDSQEFWRDAAAEFESETNRADSSR